MYMMLQHRFSLLVKRRWALKVFANWNLASKFIDPYLPGSRLKPLPSFMCTGTLAEQFCPPYYMGVFTFGAFDRGWWHRALKVDGMNIK